MRPEEAAWLAAAFADVPSEELSPLLELGSASAEYRTRQQPHIEHVLHAPLRARGVKIVHADIKPASGVDISGDIFEQATQDRLRAVGAKAILCSNMLMHLTTPDALPGICDQALLPGGLLFMTASSSYPHTLDPIDNGLRPSPERLAQYFPAYKTMRAGAIRSITFWRELEAAGRPVSALARYVAKCAVIRGGLRATKARAHRLAWLWRPYETAAVVLRKPA